MNNFKKWYLENSEISDIPNTPNMVGEVQVSIPKSQSWYSDARDFSIEGGFLRVVKNPQAPTDWSVTMTEVDETQRRKGLATKLIKAMLSTINGSIGAQCSNDGSIKLYWNLGFRLPNNKTFEDALKIRRDMSSVNLIHP